MKTYKLYDNANNEFYIHITDNNLEVKAEGLEVSDGYHTMSELYDHRRALTAALLNIISNECPGGVDPTFKSKLHADGTMFEGYFICGFNYFNGDMISYHYALEYWDDFRIPEYVNAPEYDGHTSADVIERLLKL